MKKANKNAALKKSRSAQNATKKESARSSRVSSREEVAPATESDKNLSAQVAPIKTYSKPGSSKFLTNVLRILALFGVVALTVYISSLRDRVEQFASFGYPGIFLIALLANATILLPAPGVAIIYAMGSIFNPLGVGLAAGTGGAIGELSGYLAGFSGQAVVERADVYNRIKPWIDKYGGWAILVLSAIPNPFFDIAGIAAGIAKMPVRVFLFFTWIGQLIKMTIFALAGHYSITLITNFLK